MIQQLSLYTTHFTLLECKQELIVVSEPSRWMVMVVMVLHLVHPLCRCDLLLTLPLEPNPCFNYYGMASASFVFAHDLLFQSHQHEDCKRICTCTCDHINICMYMYVERERELHMYAYHQHINVHNRMSYIRISAHIIHISNVQQPSPRHNVNYAFLVSN